MSDLMRALIRGFVWKCRMSNGAIFEWWTPTKVSHKVAKKALMDFANGVDKNGRGWSDPPIYNSEDVDAVWETKGVRR